MNANAHGTVFGIRGCLIDTPRAGELRVVRDGGIVVEEGFIAEAGEFGALAARPRPLSLRWLHSGRAVVFPGLIDLHTHLPQYPAVARPRGGLLPWLAEVVYPLEREFVGKRAAVQAERFFGELARHGTATAMVWAAAYEESCAAVFEAARAGGNRAVVGQVLMDVDPYAPGVEGRRPGTLVTESERLCRRWHGAADGLLGYAFSPRFAPVCSESLMRAAGTAAAALGAFIQTHFAEAADELAAVRARFPWAGDYLAVYERCGLLGGRTVLAHAVHAGQRELEAMAAAGTAVAHCPTANQFLGSGLLPLGDLRAAGVRVGLGTDVAAGPELNMWQVMRSTIETQQARACFEPNVWVPTPADTLHMATLAAADILGQGDRLGSLDIGKEADLTVMDAAALLPYARDGRALADLAGEDLLALCVYRGGPAAVLETFVRGRAIYQAPEPELL